MSATPPPGRTPLDVQCKPCGFRWTAAYLPMEAGKVARLLRGMGCPTCGASSRQIFIAIDEPKPRDAKA